MHLLFKVQALYKIRCAGLVLLPGIPHSGNYENVEIGSHIVLKRPDGMSRGMAAYFNSGKYNFQSTNHGYEFGRRINGDFRFFEVNRISGYYAISIYTNCSFVNNSILIISKINSKRFFQHDPVYRSNFKYIK